MLRNLSYQKYDDDDAFYAVNGGDSLQGDDLSEQPDATREIRAATVASILRAVQNPANVLVKVSRRGPPPARIRGYATFARFLEGATPQQFERMLGFRDGVLQEGCNVYYLDPHDLKPDNIGPRYLSSWSAGVSPRDLHTLSQQAGVPVGYHRDYPVAPDPIFQFVIFRPEVSYFHLRVLQPNERFDGI